MYLKAADFELLAPSSAEEPAAHLRRLALFEPLALKMYLEAVDFAPLAMKMYLEAVDFAPLGPASAEHPAAHPRRLLSLSDCRCAQNMPLDHFH
jgi:hypothetical protein